MDDINCSNCMIMDFKESLCDNCAAMKRRGRAEELEKLIINMPRWIPLTEALPAVGETVLLSGRGKWIVCGYITAANGENRPEWVFGGWYHPFEDVDAWMPLPEPLEGEKE